MVLSLLLFIALAASSSIAEGRLNRDDVAVESLLKQLVNKALPELKVSISRSPSFDAQFGEHGRRMPFQREDSVGNSVEDSIEDSVEDSQEVSAEDSTEEENLPSSCTLEYAALEASTMCNYWDEPGVINSGVSELDQDIILTVHNDFRRGVSPTATNMVRMYYDEDIAVIAQKYANTCPDDHDTNEERMVPGYGINVGQNLAWGFTSWEDAMTAWHDEVQIYQYGAVVDYLGPGEMIGHYTQMVTAEAVRIGCGYSECPTTDEAYYQPNYVCNYAYGQSSWSFPYEAGPTCDACQAFCFDGLCDCGDKLCVNGGVLDVENCECVCPAPYEGLTCQEVVCPIFDEWYCSDWPVSYCDIYSNVPGECPIMCGLCEEVCPGMTADYCQNGGILDASTSPCTCNCPDDRIGDQCELYAVCPLDEDAWYCGSSWPLEYCTMYYNVPDVCPFMCGIC